MNTDEYLIKSLKRDKKQKKEEKLENNKKLKAINDEMEELINIIKKQLVNIDYADIDNSLDTIMELKKQINEIINIMSNEKQKVIHK